MESNAIDQMTDKEVLAVCEKILSMTLIVDELVTGCIIEKLEDWQINHRRHVISGVWHIWCSPTVHCFDKSLPRCFLKTAKAIGKWTPPVKEPRYSYWMEEDGFVTTAFNNEKTMPNKKRVRCVPFEEGK